MGNLEILAEIASKRLITESKIWKKLREDGFSRQNAVCGKRTGSRKNQGFYRRMLAYDEDFPNYKKMQKTFRAARDLILLQ
tara:strand:+ start:1689 stop:1931 length:243 start_codon:yes stop_codon:yes gene_type:complete